MRRFAIPPAILAACALVFAVPATATVARVRGLGVPTDYLQTETTGMATWLSEVVGAGNRVNLEVGSTDADWGDHAVGLVLPGLFGERSGVWAIELNQTAPALGEAWAFSPITSGWGGFDRNEAGQAFQLTWGRRVKEADVALRVQRSFVSYDDGLETTEGESRYGRNVLGFAAGAGANLGERLRWQLAAHVQRRAFDEGGSGAHDDGRTSYLVAARALHTTTRALALVPSLKYWSQDLGLTDHGTNLEHHETRTGFQAGFAGNWSLSHGDLLVAGAEFVRNKVEFEEGDEEDETMAPNVFLALETHPAPWLALRAGAQDVMFYRWHNSFSGGDRTYREHYFRFALGGSVRFDRFTLDATLDPAFLQNPFAQLTGGTRAYYANASAPPRGAYTAAPVAFPQASLTYFW